MKIKAIAYSLLLILFCLAGQTRAQRVQQRVPEKTRILLLLDASNSMLAPWGQGLRIHVAKRQLARIVDSLRVNKNLEIGLRVYGHQYNYKMRNCTDTKLEVPFRANNHDQIIAALRDLKPQGATPIAHSLQQAAADFTPAENVRNVVIIITDGVESCDGDPCAVSMALQRKKVFLRPFVIGLGMDRSFEDQFKCVGEYYEAESEDKFRRAVERAIDQSLRKTTVSVELLDINNRPLETDVNVSFFNNFTQAPLYEFVHWRDPRGRPDSVEVEPVLAYDVWVNTIPPVVKRGVVIEAGKHNVIPIQCPQGQLTLRMRNATEYRDGLQAAVLKGGNLLHHQRMGETNHYLVGKYLVEVLTTPRSTYQVEIGQSRNTVIDVPEPGSLHVIAAFKGHGSIYKLLPEGGQEWFYDLAEDPIIFNITMQPGEYKLVFRSDRALGSKFTQIKNFSIKSGVTTEVKLDY